MRSDKGNDPCKSAGPIVPPAPSLTRKAAPSCYMYTYPDYARPSGSPDTRREAPLTKGDLQKAGGAHVGYSAPSRRTAVGRNIFIIMAPTHDSDSKGVPGSVETGRVLKQRHQGLCLLGPVVVTETLRNQENGCMRRSGGKKSEKLSARMRAIVACERLALAWPHTMSVRPLGQTVGYLPENLVGHASQAGRSTIYEEVGDTEGQTKPERWGREAALIQGMKRSFETYLYLNKKRRPAPGEKRRVGEVEFRRGFALRCRRWLDLPLTSRVQPPLKHDPTKPQNDPISTASTSTCFFPTVHSTTHLLPIACATADGPNPGLRGPFLRSPALPILPVARALPRNHPRHHSRRCMPTRRGARATRPIPSPRKRRESPPAGSSERWWGEDYHRGPIFLLFTGEIDVLGHVVFPIQQYCERARNKRRTVSHNGGSGSRIGPVKLLTVV
ncbi:hypothetical protein BDK51DRAFT_52163 [Blyttiomyces helicus]|uniref:Uncharacterized protein n=1 Tax=Blyttiomyces helicus TaxID=388810 RepID=A0A4P9WHQ7_9FUNG|nr:hypothetical protein BDK51DRAFT_52163 [Blyttiomyces helicus]|eukprot:RKO92371.1 hypothetical protein BDK51DRAFT_52163 [Blyttiomyces helicus]